MRFAYSLLIVSLLVPPAAGQSVISVRSGLINYSDGVVFIDNQPIANKFGKYTHLKEGSDLLTQDGRAEILLTPNAYLRVGMNSGIRMVSSNLADTQLQILSGSAIFDSGNADQGGPPVTLITKSARIQVEVPSRLRIDSEPEQVRVEKGKALIIRAGVETRVGADQLLPLAGTSVVQRMTDNADDMLELWSQQRNRLIYLNLASAQKLSDPGIDDGSQTLPADLSAWLGYVPPASVMPLSGTYLSAMPAYGYGYGGYYSPYSPWGFYGPRFGLSYALGYGSDFGFGYGFGGGFGYGFGSRLSSGPRVRFTPVYPGTYGIGFPGVAPSSGLQPIAPVHGGIGPIRGGVPSMGSPFGISRPAVPMSRPAIAAPHVPAHR
ncbi:MAG TPA: hypothetical protein VHB50_10930 [Bryobacteraceae bacterium]|nr:hypothetical protein [Bryobacteraceae bacterium]